MATVTKLGYWAGNGSSGANDYHPEYLDRFTITAWNIQDSARRADGILLANFTTSDTLDAGVIPSADKLPAQTPIALGLSTNPIDLSAALTALAIGGTLTIPAGIYTLDPAALVTLGAGQVFSVPGTQAQTTIQAATNARVVIVGTDGSTPKLQIGDYATVKGIWAVGTPDTNGNSLPMGKFCVVQDCLFAGYKQCIIEGDGHNNQYLRNTFYNCGRASLDHAIYIAGSSDVTYTLKNDLVQANVFLDCPSYPIHLFHLPQSVQVYNNFIARGNILAVDQGKDHDFQRNILWSSVVAAFQPAGTNSKFRKNLIGYSTQNYNATWGDGTLNHDSNRYIQTVRSTQDSAPVTLQLGDILGIFGYTYTQVEDAMNVLETKFSAIDSTLFNDGTVDYYINVLKALATSNVIAGW